jgi:non-heme chloroperoxidase
MSPAYEQHWIVSEGGVRIAVREYGQRTGPVVIFIHGYCCSQLVFSKQVASDLARQFRLISYDLRGHGESDQPSEPAAYAANGVWSKDLHAVIEGLQVERAILVGWSMGGRVAANYLHTHGQDRVCGVNFVNSTALAGPKFNTRGPDAGIAMETLASAREDFIRGTARFVRGCTHIPMQGEDFEQMFGAAMSVPLHVRKGCFAWHIDYADSLRALDVPVLATHGVADRMCLPAAAEAIASRMQNVEVSLVPDVGHMPFWESPERFNRELGAFASRCFGAKRTVERRNYGG